MAETPPIDAYEPARVPPQNIDAEECVLGAILLKNEAIDEVEFLEPEDFYQHKSRTIFDVMRELTSKRQPVDLVTLGTRLRELDQLEAVGGEAHLAYLAGRVPTAANIVAYGKDVLKCSELRTLIAQAKDIETLAYDRDAEGARAKADEIGLTQGRGVSRMAGRFHLARAGLAHLEKVGSREITGVPTGLADLDFKTSGLQPTDLIIIAGRPSMGKTALALNIGDYAASQGFPVFMASMEMSTAQLSIRLACSGSGFDSEEMRRGKVDYTDAFHRVGELPFYVDDTPAQTVGQIRSGARKVQRLEHKLIEKVGMGLVIVDYLQLCTAPGRHGKREEEVAAVSRSLKALAKDLGWPVLALSQLNRGVEARSDKRPNLGDLRESGQIEQDADIVSFIYRDEHYNPGGTVKIDGRQLSNAGLAELNMEKNRSGATGMICLAWRNKITKFSNWSGF